MKINITPLSQRDERWKSVKLGFGTGTTGNYGCIITDIAMNLGITPDIVNEKLKTVQAFTGKSKNLVDWTRVPMVFPQLSWEGKKEKPVLLSEIDGLLEQGKAVILRVEADEIGTPKGTHFVLAIGKEGDDYLVNDPWSGDQVKLCERYSEAGSRKPQDVILGIRKLVLKQGISVEQDKQVHYYIPGDENEDPSRLRTDRDKNWKLYNACNTQLENLPNTQGQLDALRQFKEDVSVHLKKVNRDDTVAIMGRIDALVAKESNADNWEDNFIELAYQTLMSIPEIKIEKKEPKVLMFGINELHHLYKTYKTAKEELESHATPVENVVAPKNKGLIQFFKTVWDYLRKKK